MANSAQLSPKLPIGLPGLQQREVFPRKRLSVAWCKPSATSEIVLGDNATQTAPSRFAHGVQSNCKSGARI